MMTILRARPAGRRALLLQLVTEVSMLNKDVFDPTLWPIGEDGQLGFCDGGAYPETLEGFTDNLDPAITIDEGGLNNFLLHFTPDEYGMYNERPVMDRFKVLLPEAAARLSQYFQDTRGISGAFKRCQDDREVASAVFNAYRVMRELVSDRDAIIDAGRLQKRFLKDIDVSGGLFVDEGRLVEDADMYLCT